MRRFVPMALVALLLGACSWWMAGRPLIFGGHDLTFTHELHMGEVGMECNECHGEVAGAEDFVASYLPDEEVCMDCHFREDDCSWCHTDPDSRGPRPERVVPAYTISHRSHLEREAECTDCHADATTSGALPLMGISMDTCLNCHNHEEDYAQGRCNQCHESMERMPLSAVAEYEHSGGWIDQHGLLAHNAGASCGQCHSQTMCTDCHTAVSAIVPADLFPEEVETELRHRGDFITTHSMEARADAGNCATCHDSNECRDCHTAYGVSDGIDEPFLRHPDGWISGHGTEARLRIETCASCHDQGAASNCVECHAVGRVGGNPHPDGWASSHEREDVAGNPMCLSCHVNGI